MSGQVIGPDHKTMYDYYSQYNDTIIQEMMQAPIPDIKVISQLLTTVTDSDLIKEVTDFIDKEIQNVLNNIEYEFQQDLLNIPAIRQLRKKLHIREEVVINNDKVLSVEEMILAITTCAQPS